MKFLSVICVLLIAIAAQAKAQSVLCYVCQGSGCDGLTENDLQYCGPSTAPTESTSPTGSTESTEPGTTSSPISESTGSSTDSTASESTASESTASESTASESTASESTASESTASESTASESTASESTASESTASESTVSESTATESAETTANDDDTRMMLRNYRALSRVTRDVDEGYACFSIDVTENNDKTVHRGCVAISSNQTGCEAVLEAGGWTKDNTENCYLCQTDGCNGSAAVKFSIALLSLITVVKFVLLN